jgi:hypothetical protein
MIVFRHPKGSTMFLCRRQRMIVFILLLLLLLLLFLFLLLGAGFPTMAVLFAATG